MSRIRKKVMKKLLSDIQVIYHGTSIDKTIDFNNWQKREDYIVNPLKRIATEIHKEINR